MQLKIFSLPINGDEQALEELNHFLRANKIIEVRKECVAQSGCWTFCVTYMENKNNVTGANVSTTKKDYKEILSEEEFVRFTELRKIRKSVAESEAVPAYAVFTDAELSEMSKLQTITIKELQKIPGIGEKRVEKYGEYFINSIKKEKDEESGESV